MEPANSKGYKIRDNGPIHFITFAVVEIIAVLKIMRIRKVCWMCCIFDVQGL
jgi:hypothetical protein